MADRFKGASENAPGWLVSRVLEEARLLPFADGSIFV